MVRKFSIPSLQCLSFISAVTVGLFAFALTVSPQRAAAQTNDILKAVVGLKAEVPADARTATFLGTERQGTGVVIDDNGLILTIGYLILEAAGAVITGPDGKQYAATVTAYDHDSGFGLIRARNPKGLIPLRLGNSSEIKEGDQALAVSHGGPQPIIPARVVSRRTFVGYWEYLVDNAIFTSPPHSFHSGAALIGEDGRLLGIGSLFVGDAGGGGRPLPGNMFLPVDELKPILADLLVRGKRSTPPRPWIGVNTNEVLGRIIVSRVSPNGPGARAGIDVGDIILGLNGQPLRDQTHFYRKLWRSGSAGVTVPLDILPKGQPSLTAKRFEVQSMDRLEWLKLAPTF
ncbi:MAG: S1C family serine protease [Proteobacteria bacterium]|nr:S1C family serine protease [Pseudomonadota bacterium]